MQKPQVTEQKAEKWNDDTPKIGARLSPISSGNGDNEDNKTEYMAKRLFLFC